MRLFTKTVIVLFTFVLLMASVNSYASGTKDLLRQGLLGAGAGAAGSAAGGGNAGTGALVGAGVNILGGALLDSLTEPDRGYPQQQQPSSPTRYGYQTREPVQQQQPQQYESYSQPRDAYSQGYEDGYSNGYKAGYTAGYKEGLKEAYKDN
jgi:hypothetical protein